MRHVVEEVPVERRVVVPLPPLPDLPSHEEKLLSRLRIHVGEQQPEIGELLPVVAGHLSDQRSLAVHDFVVRQGEHEVLREGVHHAEGQIVVMKLAVDGIFGEVAQRVVHPSHVPLHPESKPADVRRPRHHRPRRRLLGDHLHVRMDLVDVFIHPADEGDGFDVLPPAEIVRNPLALFARVVEVEHRGDRVDAQRVHVIDAEPVEGAAEQKAAHLVAPIVEDQRAPVGMESLARIGVLVQVCSVEIRQTVLVGGKV